MTDNRLTYLFYRYFDGTATPIERKEFTAQLHSDEHQDAIKKLMEEAWSDFSFDAEVFSADKSKELYHAIAGISTEGEAREDDDENIRKPFYRIYWRAAAAVLLLFGLGYYYVARQFNQKKTLTAPTVTVQNDRVTPGGNRATLTLSNGATILLDSASKGLLAKEGSSLVIKSSEGQLVYQSAGAASVSGSFNTITTPRGGQYNLILPDGSRVWLNAASSIHYPTSFAAKERIVEITGEAYFEISKDPTKPFTVITQDTKIRVLGTHFNVNAYEDEKVLRTTLLEGSVSIERKSSSALLAPGQAADVERSAKSSNIIVSSVNAAKSIAWKEGYFQFDQTDLSTVMRQLSRWYNVDVSYEGIVPKREFDGEIDRQTPLTEVLKILKTSNINFRVEGSHLIVTP